jgi:DNA-binding GntR family transcriptional regulator
MALARLQDPGRRPSGPRSRSRPLYETLQREIVLGTLPPEQSLTEMELAQRFGCSQGTVREALMLLAETGLVERWPNRGTRVVPCAAADARALLSIRRAIECDHVARVIAGSDAAHRAALHDMLNAMRNAARDDDEYLLSVCDRRFHAMLFAAADLPLVAPVLDRCVIHSHRFKILSAASGRALEATAERHVPILDALADGDAVQLAEVLSHHVATIVDFGADLSDDAGSA